DRIVDVHEVMPIRQFHFVEPTVMKKLPNMPTVNIAFAAIPAGWFMARYGAKKVLILGFLAFAASAGMYLVAANWLFLVPASLLSALAPSFIYPLSDIIIVEVTREGSRAAAMGFSRTVWNAFALFAPPVATMLVVTFGGLTLEAMRPLFLVQFTAAVGVALALAAVLENSETLTANAPSLGLIEVLNNTRLLLMKKGSFAWMLAMSAQRFSTGIAMAYLPLWLVGVRGADPYIIGAMNTAGVIAVLLLSAPVGVIADRLGWLKVFLVTRTFLYLGTLLMLLIPAPSALVLAGAFGTFGFMYGVGGVSFIPFITAFWESPQPNHRGSWLTASNMLGGLIGAVAPLVGGIVWDAGYRDLTLLLPLFVDLASLFFAIEAKRYSNQW
ncbi:MAG: MFS transporter, partial [Thermofilaceae archaeon]